VIQKQENLFMTDFYIFGDSFGEEKRVGARRNLPGIYWYDVLRSLGQVHNYCLGCTGPIRNIKLLLEKKLKNTNIIFLSSIKYRIQFPFSKNIEHNEVFKEIHDTKKSPRTEVDYALEWQYEIDLIYTMFGDEIEMSTFLCILYLHFYALKNNCKILVFLCDREGSGGPLNGAFEYDSYVDENYFYFNTEHFNVHRKNIWHMSAEEFETGVVDQVIENNRVSHISDCNHKIMFNIISNFFKNTTLSETFHQNLYKGAEGEKQHTYIYE